MKERIKALRKALCLTQQEFGEKIGVKQGSIASYENGARVPLDVVVNSLCHEFNVNEVWLRTGEGDMFNPVPTQEVDGMPSWALSDFGRSFISALTKLDPEQWQLLEKIMMTVMNDLEGQKKADP